MKCLVVGLGNPGKEYQGTRHNVGFDVLDAIAHKCGIAFKNSAKFSAQVADCVVGNTKIKLMKPATFMNNSGRAVLSAVQYYKIHHENILIVYDDLDLPSGTIKIKKQGGHAGHNGIKSILDSLGTEQFIRVRFGIDKPKANKVSYVLERPNSTQKKAIDMAIENLLTEFENMLVNIEKVQQSLHSKN